mmetsp:Transcript_34665/g.53076  ORF Transcript_34665/g.53076 Transcript_34665/m.53076 type:complete len:226 (+) Transcript_34665:539-1216(+)
MMNMMNFDNKDVDLYHKMAYAFKQSSRFFDDGREKQFNETNEQIKELLTVKKMSPFLHYRGEEDPDETPMDAQPMLIFYALYFSIFYLNKDLLEFLTNYIKESGLGKEAEELLNEEVSNEMPDNVPTPGSCPFPVEKQKSLASLQQTVQSGYGGGDFYSPEKKGLERPEALCRIGFLFGLIPQDENKFKQEFELESGENNKRIYNYLLHAVLQQAIEDNMRIVYD